jgi:hypothetical protein
MELVLSDANMGSIPEGKAGMENGVGEVADGIEAADPCCGGVLVA